MREEDWTAILQCIPGIEAELLTTERNYLKAATVFGLTNLSLFCPSDRYVGGTGEVIYSGCVLCETSALSLAQSETRDPPG